MDKNKLKLEEYFILIDDDPIYRTIMARAAEMEDVRLDVFGSITDIGVTSPQSKYTAAIVDYDLNGTNGVEAIFALASYFGDIPTILVSAKDREPSADGWPASVKRFVKKSQGYSYALLEAQKFSELEGEARVKFKSKKKMG